MPRGKPAVPRGPNMKATLERHVMAEPSKFHYQAARRALQGQGISCSVKDIPKMHHVKELAIWVDTVLWCSGDGTARGALLDRMLAKEARLIVDAELSSRVNLANNNNVSTSDADEYMAMLEQDVKRES